MNLFLYILFLLLVEKSNGEARACKTESRPLLFYHPALLPCVRQSANIDMRDRVLVHWQSTDNCAHAPGRMQLPLGHVTTNGNYECCHNERSQWLQRNSQDGIREKNQHIYQTFSKRSRT